MIKISIIVPIYNSKKYLERCINSLVNQKKTKDYEIILIDDGSTDGSEAICDEYSKRYNNIKVFHKSNEGVSKARNLGILKSSGEYITFVDSDDYIEENMMHEFIEKISRNNSDIVFCGQNNISIISNNKKEYKAYNFNNIKIKEFLDKYFSYYYNNYLIQGPFNKFYKRNIIIDNNIKFDETLKICEDAIFVIDFLLNSNTVSSFESCNYNYMQNGTENTLLRKFNKNEIEANWKLYYSFEHLFKKYNSEENNMKLIKMDFINRFIICLKKMFLKSNYSKSKLLEEVNNYIYDRRTTNIEKVKYKSNILNKLIYFTIRHKQKKFTYSLLKLYVLLKKFHFRRK